MFSHKFPISGSKGLGFTSKGSHTQGNQAQGKTLPGLFTDPYAHPNMDISTYARKVREETNVFTKTLLQLSCQSCQGF